MLDTEEQLARLRQRVAAIDRRFQMGRFPETASFPLPEPAPSRICGRSVEEWCEGEVVTNDGGSHFQMERLFPGHKQHGSADIGSLAHLPHDFLGTVSDGAIPPCCPSRWCFLDTETTGLAGGSGTYAFLIGIGRITPDGFRVRQFFLREYAEEPSTLLALTEHLAQFDVMITYNGRSYDQPLLETRYRMTRQKPPFARLGHLDLLYGARRLWKLRLENCRLVQLEQQILGMFREGDLAGELIPYVYFDFVRSRDATRLTPIFHHNAMDILTLACLTGIVSASFNDFECVRHGSDLTGIARWLMANGEAEQALRVLRRAISAGLHDGLLFRAQWDMAGLEKKLGNQHAAIEILMDLAGCRNAHRVPALEELAKFYEHTEKNLTLALDFTYQALSFGSTASLLGRRDRLQARLARTPIRRRA